MKNAVAAFFNLAKLGASSSRLAKQRLFQAAVLASPPAMTQPVAFQRPAEVGPMGRIRRNTNRWRFQLFPTLVFTGLGAIIGAVTTPIGPLQWQGIVGTAAIGLIVGIVLGGFVRKGSRNRG